MQLWNGDPGQLVQGQVAFHTATPPPPPAPGPPPHELGKPCSPSAWVWTCSPALSPHLGVGAGEQAAPLPIFPTAQGKIVSISKLPVPLCHVWAKAACRRRAASWAGVGAGIKTVPLFCQIPKGVGWWGWGWGWGRKREGWKMEAPAGFLWGGLGTGGCPLISRWRPWGKFLFPRGSQTGRFARGPSRDSWWGQGRGEMRGCRGAGAGTSVPDGSYRHFLSPSWVPGLVKDRGKSTFAFKNFRVW